MTTTKYNNLSYDNGTNLVELDNRKYVVNWIYRANENIGSVPHAMYILGNAQYTKPEDALTENAPVMATLPQLIQTHGVLVGRIIVRKSETTGLVESAWSQVYAPGTIIATKTSFAASSIQNIEAATGITDAMIEASTIIRVQGNAGDVVVTATPSIPIGADGQMVIIEGSNSAATVTLRSEANLVGTRLNLAHGVDYELEAGDTITLIYNSTTNMWNEISRSKY